jgi:hypothetical protein
MRRTKLFLLFLLVPLALGPGCDCGGDKTGAGGGAGGGDGGAGGVGGGGGSLPIPDGGVVVIPGVDGGEPTICHVTMCPDGNLFACGDCVDNDGDGKIDTGDDPDCLGPCHNNEAGYDPNLTGQPEKQCRVDCYYDSNSGRDCDWDWRCDPLAPRSSPDYANCTYVGDDEWGGTFGSDEPGVCVGGGCTGVSGSDSCYDLQQTQQTNGACDGCAALTPPGCDCFGCCEIPARSGNFVFIGTKDGETPTCDFDAAVGEYELDPAGTSPEDRLATRANDQRACSLCTPQTVCANGCGTCELCLGQTELPPECTTPPGTDGGTPPAACNGGPSCAPISDDACPAGLTCFFGCCLSISPI